MVMENIKQLYEKLSGKKLYGDDPIISLDVFSSILRDRFSSEIKKLGINWNGEPMPISKLFEDNFNNTIIQDKPTKSKIQKSNSSNLKIGIDIQFIGDFHVPEDYWNDPFYLDNFTESEIVYALSKHHPQQTFAGIYSLKESIYKSDNSINRKAIQIDNENGIPTILGYSISLSHSKDYVVSTAILLNQSVDSLQSLSSIGLDVLKPIHDAQKEEKINYQKNEISKIVIINTIILFFILTLYHFVVKFI
jgi:phosphopantetheinyl transferase (holo-ACP synthase)